jgi:putative spermidine/putrescine transport system ATP-binding protein
MPATPFVAGFVGLSNRVPARVEDGHAVLLGTRVPVLDGSATGGGLALVRPEALALRRDEGAGTAVVVDVSFLGPVSRATAALDDGTELVAQLTSATARGLSVGDRVRVEVEPRPVLVVGA